MIDRGHGPLLFGGARDWRHLIFHFLKASFLKPEGYGGQPRNFKTTLLKGSSSTERQKAVSDIILVVAVEYAVIVLRA